ncbi:arginine--tRNA ligase [Terribacillus sp. AE2B 122]|uniref:arginine--tRNA ligase n=1 Tax=Terribacillus sp. AE2B 122 TaxID=1331902 RepID=UPI001440D0B7|nr:arginine--tRNA ligase [Terribacillus sp. AE2B 122]VVM34792.1 Arginyl-tRNA synthetase (EC 6.1.1.19) [Terribacillus sp. AE2B 122]
MYKSSAAELLAKALNKPSEETIKQIERPKQLQHGDYAFPCFALAKEKRQSPQSIAAELAAELTHEEFSAITAVGGYVNFTLDKKLAGSSVLKEIHQQRAAYGSTAIGQGQTVTIDLSSPNIAKPFSMGHLRSTVIGNSISLLLEKQGYDVVRINHVGDWGTQFGKLICAYEKWGEEEKVRANTIPELLKLYVRFHEEAAQNEQLEQEGRNWFRKLEQGDAYANKLWHWFRDVSMKEFGRVYELMGVHFDSDAGEAFYNDKMERAVEELEQNELLSLSDGAQVVRLDEFDLPPSLIKKKDGATLYATRDLAAAIYRKETYQFSKSLYVVGHEQSLHFQQLKIVLNKMGYEWAEGINHIPFGMVLQDGKKMSTRKGKLVLLDKVLEQAIQLAATNIAEKNPNLPDKEEVARQVGVGAVLFHDLKHERIHDIDFSLEDMLRVEGETGPYVQYTHARACTLLAKGGEIQSGSEVDGETAAAAWPILSLLLQFPDTVGNAAINYDPSRIAKYVIDLAQAFNSYYGRVRILEEDEKLGARLAVVGAVASVLEEGLRLLGIRAPRQM